MCRLFAMSGGDTPIGATFWLLDAEDSLLLQSEQNPDGTGIAWFDAVGGAIVEKQPIAGIDDPDFSRDAQEIRSRSILAHVRYATATARTIANTQPFLHNGLVFGHNGVVGDLDKIEARLGDAYPHLQGDNDSERLFALIISEIDRAGGAVVAGITNAVRWLADEAELYSINFVMASEGEIWALRYPDDNTLYLLKRRAEDPSPSGHPYADTDEALATEGATTTGLRLSAPDTAHQSAVIIASEPLNGDDWREIPAGQLIHVDRQLRIHRHQVLDHAPRHKMVLGGQAAASQGVD